MDYVDEENILGYGGGIRKEEFRFLYDFKELFSYFGLFIYNRIVK